MRCARSSRACSAATSAIEERLTDDPRPDPICRSDRAQARACPFPVELSYDDYTEDIIENQILKTATLALLRLPAHAGARPQATH